MALRVPNSEANPMTTMTRFDYRALGRLPAGAMNKTETSYAAHLEWRKQRGDILWFKFEGVKLRLADSTFYTCDFMVLRNDGQTEMHEVKGYMTDDAAVKIKVAASIYPFQFYIVRKSKVGWTMSSVGNAA
jgi:hypothetical protein